MQRWKKLVMTGGGLGAAAIALPRLRARSLPLRLSHPGHDVPYGGLATSLPEDVDETARVEGRLPPALEGTLYINGPGLFARDGRRKRNLLDGDGLVTAFTLRNGAAHLRARYVRTDKLREEDAAGRYLYATWTTQRPGGLLRNLGLSLHPRGQAGVTVKRWDDRLFAFDEGVQPWELEPATLETLGYAGLGLAEGRVRYAAHPKVDPVAREWIHFGMEYGRRSHVHLTIFGADMTLRSHRRVPLAGAPYMHDFAVSEGHIVLVRHPTDVALPRVLCGLSSFKDAMAWRPERGNQVLLFDRGGAQAPLILETEASWMWHSLNAYDRGHETIVDFVGYDHPDHFLGEGAALSEVMRGRAGSFRHPGKLRRYTIDRAAGSIRQQILDHGHHDFPFVDPRRSTRRHRHGYFAAGTGESFFWSSVVRADMDQGLIQRHDFGAGQYCLEPVFAPRPGGPEDAGWILTLVYDARRNASRLAVLDAERIADGPIAEIQLHRALPFRFHGAWWPSATPVASND
jgi:all-trans-8'-apo-beta-carotenal 15,15'-oxygenase